MKNAIKSIFTSALFVVISFAVQAQITNAVRGQVIEKITRQSLPGATVLIIDSDPLIGTTTDMDGYFEISNVPVGRVSIQISFLGYETVVLQD
ncbi:MAG: carboxypeptidase-like regulatory domain-containing protein, partial [Salibacteraceae bacterium]|nr:carboxypeptidase-like regulatory domain-containing protein [Salibacteraceae bacterium]